MNEAEAAAKREAILQVLTDAENSKVSTAEGGKGLQPGDAYIDLEQLDKGIQQGTAGGSIGHIIPKSAISTASWSKIVAMLK